MSHWFIWFIAAVVIIIMAFASVASADECGIDWEQHCTGTRWVLHVDGEPIDVGSDLTKEECVALAAQIDPGPPFTDIIQCVEEKIVRTES